MKTALYLFLIIILASGCSHKETNELLLTGNIAELKKGTLYIKKLVDTTLVSVDTIVINGASTFETRLKIESPEMHYLMLDRGTTNSIDNSIPFFAEAGTMHIETNLAHFLSDSKITGSKNQLQYEEYRKIISRFNDQSLMLTELKFKAFQDKKQPVIDSIEKAESALIRRKYLYTVNFAMNHKQYEVAPYIVLAEIPDVSLKYIDTIQKSITPEVKRSLYGKKLLQWYAQRKKMGE